MSKVALITGITGQDGSYLAEFLLEKGYEVHGIIRRSSSFNTGRIEHLYMDDLIKDIHNKKINLHYGDMTDSTNMIRIIKEVEPDEIYNLAAMSHVKVSFEVPEYTADTDGIGTLRILEAVRFLGFQDRTRIYQASTSELYGKVQEVPQNETTPFYPRSPYGVAKLYGFWISKNYRESYDMFVSNGILFNHETVSQFMPVIFKEGDTEEIDIKPISEVVKYHTLKKGTLLDTSKEEYQEGSVETDLYIWDKEGWTRVKFASGYPSSACDKPKNPRFINSRSACYMATDTHEIIMEDGTDKEVRDISLGDKVSLVDYPSYSDSLDVSCEEASFLGLMVADGYHRKDGNGCKFVKSDRNLIDYVSSLWESFGGTSSVYETEGGFESSKKTVYQLRLNGSREFWDRFSIYTEDRDKRVPKQILNSSYDIKLSFLKSYNKGDGLKAGYKVNYEMKNFKTSSPVLASGLIYLVSETTGQDFNINLDESRNFGDHRIYYSINLLSNSKSGQNHRNSLAKSERVKFMLNKGVSQREISRDTGISRGFISKVSKGYEPSGNHPSKKLHNEVKKIIDMGDYSGWYFDLETESGTFHCGIGKGHVHNSPRRGETFVTRKITLAVSRIKHGLQDKLYLGNLDAKRDWGHARDYVECMWRILQHYESDDFVIATGEMHTVREFVDLSFKEVGIDIEWQGSDEKEIGINSVTKEVLVEVDPKYYRPAEVEQLLGDPTKANTILGWDPTMTSFKELVSEMVQSDMELVGKEIK